MRVAAGSPTDAVVAVTYDCDSRCTLCNIWKRPFFPVLPPRSYRRLPVSLRNIGITGGEPTLREDIAEVVGEIRGRCPKAALTFSTNGLMSDGFERRMREILRVEKMMGVAVSLDGLGDVHDEVRGVPGAFRRAREAIALLKGMGFRDLRVSFTICDKNVGQLSAVYRLARQMGVSFTCGLAQDSRNYFNSVGNTFSGCGQLREGMETVLRGELNSFSVRRWFMAFYDFGLYCFAREKKRLLPCAAMDKQFFLDPAGEIYPCVFRDVPAGNIRDNDFFSVWRSPKAEALRSEVRGCGHGCWQICTVRASILRYFFRVCRWIISAKVTAAITGRVVS